MSGAGRFYVGFIPQDLSMGLGVLLGYTAVACEGAGALYPTVFYYRRGMAYTTSCAVSYELDVICAIPASLNR